MFVSTPVGIDVTRAPGASADSRSRSSLDTAIVKSACCADGAFPSTQLPPFEFEECPAQRVGFERAQALPDQILDVVFKEDDRNASAQRNVGGREEKVGDADVCGVVRRPSALDEVADCPDPPLPEVHRIRREPRARDRQRKSCVALFRGRRTGSSGCDGNRAVRARGRPDRQPSRAS